MAGMSDRCINPQCHHTWDSFYSGDIYVLESNSHRTRFFWLCPDCATNITLHLDGSGSVIAIPKRESASSRIPHPEHDLRLMYCFRGKKGGTEGPSIETDDTVANCRSVA